MKYIPLNAHGNWQTASVLKMVVNTNPRGMDLDEMRKRIAIMDMLDEAKTHVVVKDEEFNLICHALKTFPFGIAHKDLLAVIDGVLQADEPPVVMLESKPKKNGRSKDDAAAIVS